MFASQFVHEPNKHASGCELIIPLETWNGREWTMNLWIYHTCPNKNDLKNGNHKWLKMKEDKHLKNKVLLKLDMSF